MNTFYLKEMVKKRATDSYRSFFSEGKLWKKISRFGKQIGSRSVYAVLLLYYAYQRKETPRWAKNIIIGILGYFIAPIDFIPDLTPILGYTDDVKLFTVGLGTLAAYIDSDVKQQAKDKLSAWNFPLEDIQEVDDLKIEE